MHAGHDRDAHSGRWLGIDVGGTFTDVVWVGADGRATVAKAPTTTPDQARGVMDGIEQVAARAGIDAGALLADAEIVVHGTTVATNMMIELAGARTSMLTTRGMRDIIEIRRNHRETAFDLRLAAPTPIVPRRRRVPITERVLESGEVLIPLDEDEVRAAARRFAADGTEAIAVCFLFSFLHPEHERRAGELLRAELPGVQVSLSHEVLPRIREFERFSTTIVDAYVTPALRAYLERLERALADRGFTGDLLIMRSNGGVADVRRAASSGVQLVSSGPAGGVVAAAELSARRALANVITLDMGGTSSDVALIRDGEASIGSEGWVSRYRVAIPVVDVTSIGAGGGSIAWVDDGGALRIGPQSAGAVPGPACYGKGGTAPTVTDANVVLGYLDAERFLDGAMPLDVEAARTAIARHVGAPLGLEVEAAAAAIRRIVDHNMTNALRLVSVQRGHDPRDFALMAFGGGGPVHASALIAELGIERILVPRRYAPVLCALGDVLSDLRETASRGFYARSGSLDPEAVDALFARMADDADAAIGAGAGHLPREVDQALEMRYKGQTHEVVVPHDAGPGSAAERWDGTLARFHELHDRRFAFSRPGADVEVIGLQLDRFARRPKPDLRETAAAAPGDAAPRGHRPMWVADEQAFVSTAIHTASDLAPGFRADGPLVVEEPHTSIVVLPGQRLSLGADHLYAIETAA